MRSFLVKFLMFLVPFLAGAAVIIGAISYAGIRSPVPSNYILKCRAIESGIRDAQFINLGTSQSYYAIKAEELGVPAVNMAYISQDLYTDSELIKKYLPNARNLKLVMIETSYLSFNHHTSESNQTWRAYHYKQHFRIPLENTSWLENIKNLLYDFQQQRDYLLLGEHPVLEPFDRTGGSAQTWVTSLRALNSDELERPQHSPEDVAQVESNRRHLERILTLLRESGIRAVLFTAPTYSKYYNSVNQAQYERMQNEIRNAEQKYNVEYFNYFKDERFEMNDFYDGNHLNTAGAIKFTNIIKGEIVDKYIQTQQNEN